MYLAPFFDSFRKISILLKILKICNFFYITDFNELRFFCNITELFHIQYCTVDWNVKKSAKLKIFCSKSLLWVRCMRIHHDVAEFAHSSASSVLGSWAAVQSNRAFGTDLLLSNIHSSCPEILQSIANCDNPKNIAKIQKSNINSKIVQIFVKSSISKILLFDILISGIIGILWKKSQIAKKQ